MTAWGAMKLRLAAAGTALALLAAAVWGATLWRVGEARARGGAIYSGQNPLAARLAGHEEPLPSVATRCANCHDGQASLGGTLSAERLVQPRQRRGGPPTAFDTASLCKLLRTGIDPGHVVVASSMPRYDISDSQCTDLWTYLAAN